MKNISVVLKRTLFYPLFLMLSSGFFLLDWRGFVPLGVAVSIALAVHLAVNGYDVWKAKKAS
ncbi:hypothetical protein [Bacterioplanoides sp. SCSIO 12839]|uniref:hypothetical protein n=1 Tax=Bacterioplanoides sp. SCSIO 12839 TaxID=2829569 RepID=UPI00210683A4|nr:hypothetical protein [Bacterioplanoides sp. SCSIO 12839]UTW49272.1 hypothetical protein KFF03_05040 [Bacterioplanoides sp. SCSIO 12839]